jgi:hypothetical protein
MTRWLRRSWPRPRRAPPLEAPPAPAGCHQDCVSSCTTGRTGADVALLRAPHSEKWPHLQQRTSAQVLHGADRGGCALHGLAQQLGRLGHSVRRGRLETVQRRRADRQRRHDELRARARARVGAQQRSPTAPPTSETSRDSAAIWLKTSPPAAAAAEAMPDAGAGAAAAALPGKGGRGGPPGATDSWRSAGTEPQASRMMASSARASASARRLDAPPKFCAQRVAWVLLTAGERKGRRGPV